MSNETMINNTELFTPEPIEVGSALPATTTTEFANSGKGKFILGAAIGSGVTILICDVLIPLGQSVRTARKQRKAEKEQAKEATTLKEGVDVEVVDDGKGKKK